MAIIVRGLEPADYPAWRSLFAAYNGFYGVRLADDVVAETWSRLLARRDGLCCLVAVDSRDGVVGVAHLLFHASTWSATGYCYLEDLFVAPASRGKSVGRELLAAVYAEADERGATRTYWMTETGNTPARRLYDETAGVVDMVQYRRRGEGTA